MFILLIAQDTILHLPRPLIYIYTQLNYLNAYFVM